MKSKFLEKILYAFMIAVLLSTPVYAGDGSIDPATGNMEFEVNFRYPPTSNQIDDAKKALNMMSQMICDGTDGQIQVSNIRFTGGSAEEDKAAFWYYSNNFRSGGSIFSDGSSLTTLGSHLGLDAGAQFRADILAHEMGHHAFGLGEQYSEQRRYGGPCGIGPGFDEGNIDEVNHSMMQQTGAMACVGDADAGEFCRWDSECASNNCQPNLMSEFSVVANHDALQGNVDFPAPAQSTQIDLFGVLYEGQPIQTFDATDWTTAEASSVATREAEVLDETGNLPGIPVIFFATHTDTREWLISAAVDDGLVGGTAGDLNLLGQWTIEFAVDNSITTVTPSPAQFTLENLTSGAADIPLTVDFGTPGNTAWQDGLVNWNGVDEYFRSASDGVANCSDPFYEDGYNTGTARWESTMQTLWQGESDWETIEDNYPFVTMPAGLPIEAPQANCLIPPTYDEDINGSDQVLLIVDRSWSMSWSTRDDITEVCENGSDDDGDGTVDETDCADSRITFVRAAGRAFIDLQYLAGIDAGLIEFNEFNSLVRNLTALDAGNYDAFKMDIDGLNPGGNTAIGDALELSKAEFTSAATAGRSQTAFLLTDGFNNSGADPLTKVQDLEDMDVRVFTIPAGSAADVEGLGEIAAQTGAYMIEANPMNELPAVYAELAAQYQKSGIILPRTNFNLKGNGGKFSDEDKDLIRYWYLDDKYQLEDARPEHAFELNVEKNAKSLVAFISGRNRHLATWAMEAELHGPDGSHFKPGDPEFVVDPAYVYFRIPNPAPGTWKFVARSGNPFQQESTALAFVENPAPRLLADAKPRSAKMAKPVKITAMPVYAGEIEGDIKIFGKVNRPDGSSKNIQLAREPYGNAWSTEFFDYTTRGHYEIELYMEVGNAQPIVGESIFEGPERMPIEVVPFIRYKTLSFNLIDGKTPECRNDDCDGDGIPNKKECGKDTDNDGILNIWDLDSDNDEIPDSVEGLLDLNQNNIPDACDPDNNKPGDYTGKFRDLVERQIYILELGCKGDYEHAISLLKTLMQDIKKVIEQLNDSEQGKELLPFYELLYEHVRYSYELLANGKLRCDEAEKLKEELRYLLQKLEDGEKQR